MKKIKFYLLGVLTCVVSTIQAQNIADYQFNASSGSFNALTSATSISLSDNDDGITNDLPIGFTFNYGGNNYDEFGVSSNGFIVLGINSSGGTSLFSSGISNDLSDGFSSDRPIIAPLWDDLDVSGGSVSYKTEGTTGNRVLTVEWLNAQWQYDAPNPVISFQVKLYETDGKVEFIYRQESEAALNPSASIGLSDIGTGSGNFLSLSNASASPSPSSTSETNSINTKPATGQTYTFTKPTPAPEIELVDALDNVLNGGASVDFGNTASLTKTFTIKNKGQQNLTLGTPSISNNKFTITTAFPTSIAPGASVTFNIQYNSTQLSTSETGTLSFTTNDSDENPFVLNLSAKTIPVLTIEESSVTLNNGTNLPFGILYGLNSATKTITIQNNGTFALTLSDINTSGIGFSVEGNLPSAIAPGTSKDINLKYVFNENTDGTFSFNTNDPSNGSISFPLKGLLLPRFITTTRTFTPLTAATNANITGDDKYTNNLPIGFTFNYGGTNYDEFGVSSNGFMILGLSSSGGTNLSSAGVSNDLPSGLSSSRPVLAPLWDDLSEAKVSYKTEGTAGNRVLTVEWLDAFWDYDASDPVISFQVKIYEASGKIEFIYRQESIVASSPTASIGLTSRYTGKTSFLSLNNATASPVVSNITETNDINTKPANNQVYAFIPTLAPTITSFTPSQGIVGTNVTITGTNFNTNTSFNIVKFNGVRATVTSATATEIQTSVPAGATTGKITVEVDNLTATSATDFTVTLSANAPTITSFNPAQGGIGASVTITGTKFSTTASNNTVKFNGVTATVTSATATEIQTTVPSGATTGKITVEVNGETAFSTTDFTVTQSVALPSITSFTPAQGSIGTSVTITGANFSAIASNNSIRFNGVTAIVTSATATEIQTTVPSGATTGKVTVEVNGQTATSTTDFTVTSSVTGLPQKFQDAKLTLFPNPVVNNLHLEIKGKISSTEVKIVVLNNQGQEVLANSQTLKNGKLTLPVQGLSTGQYLIKINIGDETVLRRIIKL